MANLEISGFPTYSSRNDIDIINTVRKHLKDDYEETILPIVHSLEFLRSKGTEQELYSVSRVNKDYEEVQSKKELCLRYDLTMPFVAHIVSNANRFNTLFKRYEIGKVFRCERPQAGRYREFLQCDIDICSPNGLYPNSKAYNDSVVIGKFIDIFKSLNIPINVMIKNFDLDYFFSLKLSDGIDPSIFDTNADFTRDLNYYSGMVFEIKMKSDKALKSVAGGGRYDNLVEKYNQKFKMDMVGGSIGLSRLINYINKC